MSPADSQQQSATCIFPVKQNWLRIVDARERTLRYTFDFLQHSTLTGHKSWWRSCSQFYNTAARVISGNTTSLTEVCRGFCTPHRATLVRRLIESRTH